MKKSIMKKWVKALRSGEYVQGTGQLVDRDDNFCCLGVLCNISGVGEWAEFGEYYKGVGSYWEYKCKSSENTSMLPDEVRDWAGMRSNDGDYDLLKETLMTENDNGKSFMEIADIIEKNYESL